MFPRAPLTINLQLIKDTTRTLRNRKKQLLKMKICRIQSESLQMQRVRHQNFRCRH